MQRGRHLFPRTFGRLNLDRRSEIPGFIGNTAWLLADKLVRIAVGMVVSVWVARYLGPTDFGYYNYAIAIVALFAAMAPLGLDSIMVRRLAQDSSEKYAWLGTAFLLRLTAAIITYLLCLFAAFIFFREDSVTQILVVIIAVGTFLQTFDVIDLWFQSQTQSKYTVVAKTSAFLIVAAVRICLISLGAPLTAFAWAWLAEMFLGACALLITYRSKGHRISAWRASRHRARALLQDSWPLVLSGVVVMIYMRIDQVMLGKLTTPTEVGIYSAAVRLAELWYFLPAAITTSVLPVLIRTHASSTALYRKRLQTLFSTMTLLGYGIAVPSLFLSKPLVEFLYGAAYLPSGTPLIVLFWSGLFVALGLAREVGIVAEGLQKYSLTTTLLGAAVNVLLNSLLIPHHGALGAAVATLAAQFVAVTFALFLFDETRFLFYMQMRALRLAGLFRTPLFGIANR